MCIRQVRLPRSLRAPLSQKSLRLCARAPPRHAHGSPHPAIRAYLACSQSMRASSLPDASHPSHPPLPPAAHPRCRRDALTAPSSPRADSGIPATVFILHRLLSIHHRLDRLSLHIVTIVDREAMPINLRPASRCTTRCTSHCSARRLRRDSCSSSTPRCSARRAARWSAAAAVSSPCRPFRRYIRAVSLM